MERFAIEFEGKEILVKPMTSDNKLFMIAVDKTFFGYVAIKNGDFILQPDSSISADQLLVIKAEIQNRLQKKP